MEPGQTPPDEHFEKEVLQQLLVFLRKQNVRKRFAALDRPVWLAVLGRLLAAGVTGFWHFLEQRTSLEIQASQNRNALDLQYERALIDRKFELLRGLPTIYERCGTILNTCLANRLWLAQERNKPKWAQNQKRITEWEQDVKKGEEEFGRVEAIKGVLAQIQVLFDSDGVRNGAASMLKKWDDFEKLNSRSVGEFNSGKLIDSRISWYHDTRRQTISDLNSSKDELMRDMSINMRQSVHSRVKK